MVSNTNVDERYSVLESTFAFRNNPWATEEQKDYQQKRAGAEASEMAPDSARFWTLGPGGPSSITVDVRAIPPREIVGFTPKLGFAAAHRRWVARSR